jgi:epoxyqueuosine reductase
MLIVPGLGPAVFLGELVTNLELQPDAPISERCRQCNACAEACPTAALGPDGLNARRCISYLTTEYKGHIPPQLACKAGDRLFGCDDCVRACPFYAEAPCCSEATLSLRTGPGHLNPAEVLEWDEATFKNRTAGTPLERPGLQVLKRNAAICTNNSRQR